VFVFQIQSALSIAFFCIALHPEAQKRAQEEIDRVVGTDRLPTFEDRASLPYVEAVWRETLRWRPALPAGNAHASIADDEYNGYFIPKGEFYLTLNEVHADGLCTQVRWWCRTFGKYGRCFRSWNSLNECL
jgi:cytochrome P450